MDDMAVGLSDGSLFELLILLASISLFDSLSDVPLTSVPLIVLLQGKRPIQGAAALIAGVFVPYMILGLLIVFGLDSVFAYAMDALADRLRHPDTLDITLQIIAAAVMLGFGIRMLRQPEETEEPKSVETATIAGAFSVGAGLTIAGFPTAAPFVAAISQVLRYDPGAIEIVLILLFYTLVFVSPLAALVVIWAIFRDRSQRIFDAISAFLTKWGRRALIACLIGFGLLFIVDGIGLFFGVPVLPDFPN